MELTEAMRTCFAARTFTNEKIDDTTLYRILDHARFAPSGGNRQGWRVILVSDPDTRKTLKRLMQPTIKQYKAEAQAGETPFNSIVQTKVSAETIANTSAAFPLVDDLEQAPVLLVVCVDLSKVSSFDKDLDRVGVISGASIYPFVWNILLAARNEGLGGVLTTFVSNSEAETRKLLKLPQEFAVASLIALGRPVKQLTRLKRNPVESFVKINTWSGPAFKPASKGV